MSLVSRDKQIADSNTTLSKTSTGSKFQYVSITELISEGPIQGLVNGLSSVYLNDGRIAEEDITTFNTEQSTISSGGLTLTSGSPTVTLPTTTSDLTTDNLRNVTILNAASVNAATVTKVGTRSNGVVFKIKLTTSAAFFESWMNRTDNTATCTLTIQETAYNLHGFLEVTNSTTASFYPQDRSTATVTNFIDRAQGKTVRIGAHYQGTISSISGTTATLTENSPVSGEFEANVGSVYYSEETLSNAENVMVQFRNGDLNQSPMATFGNNSIGRTLITSTGFTAAPLEKEGNGSDDPTGNPADPPEIRGTSVNGFGLSAAQAREVDEVRLLFTYGNMKSLKSKSGATGGSHHFYDIDLTLERGSVSSTISLVTDRKHWGDDPTPTTFEEVINLEPFKPFDDFVIKVTRTSIHKGASTTANKGIGGGDFRGDFSASITSVSSVIKENLTYPYTSYANISFDSKQYSSLPTRTYQCRGLKVLVPSNYTTREENGTNQASYSGLWDGSFRLEKVYTNNPAWVFYDILTNNRYGLGDWLNAADIDKYTLYRIGKYCDELVPDGKGGQEPRYTSNIYLTKAADAYKVLKDMATSFLAMLYWVDGQVVLVNDQPKDPIYTFSKANVIEGRFSYENTGTKTRINQSIVSWNNPENNYKLEALIVEDQVNIAETGRIIPEECMAFGCTSEGQALRYGRWKLWTAINQTEIVSFETAANAAFLMPGEVIWVQDADRDAVQLAGRISNSGTLNTTTIPLDRTITLNSGSTYEVSIIVQGDLTENGGDEAPKYTEVETRTVTNSAGDTSSLSVSTAFSYDPTPESVFILKETNALNQTVAGSGKKYKILTIAQNDKMNYTISAVAYFDEKYDDIEGDFTLVAEDTVFPPIKADDTIPAVQNIYVSRYPDPTTRGDEFSVYWDIPKVNGVPYQQLDGFQIYHSVPGYPNPLSVGRDVDRLDFEGVYDDFYKVSIRTRNTAGNYSKPKHLGFDINDPFTLNIPRVQEGLGIGGRASSGVTLNESYVVNFETDPVYFAPAADPANVSTPSVTGLNTIASEIADGTYKIFYDSSAEELLAIDYYTGDTSGQNYWYDVVEADGTPEDTFVSKTGTVTVAADSNLVTGTGTSFTTEYTFNQIIKFSSTKAAKIVAVISDTQLYIDKSFDTAITASAHSAPGLSIEFEEDTLVGDFTKSGSTSTFNSYLTIDRTLQGLDGLSVLFSNDSHTLPVTNQGVVDYTGSGLTVTVLEGTTKLQYDSTATQLSELASGEYYVTLSGTNITPGALSISGTDAVIGNHSLMTADTAKVAITVVGKTSIDTTFSYVKEQTLAKAFQGADGADGADGAQGEDGLTGFFYYLSGDSSLDASNITATNPEEGQIAIVQNTSGDQAGYRYNGTAWVSQTIVNEGIIAANAITAEQLEISNNTNPGSGTYMYFDGTNNRILIYDSSVLRVKIGNLA